MPTKTICCLLAIFIAVTLTQAQAQSDAQRLSQAQFALSKSDFESAKTALVAVSPGFHKNPVWVYTLAETLDGLRDYEGSLSLYQQYDLLIPGQPAVTTKIGELLYKRGKQEEANATEKQAAIDAADKRQVAVTQKAFVDIQKTLERSLNRYGDFTFSRNGRQFHYKLTASVVNCRLVVSEETVINGDDVFYNSTENESSSLKEIDLATIVAGQDTAGGIRGNFTHFSLVGDVDHISHKDHTISSTLAYPDETISSEHEAQYFSDSAGNRDTVMSALKKAVEACQQ